MEVRRGRTHKGQRRRIERDDRRWLSGGGAGVRKSGPNSIVAAATEDEEMHEAIVNRKSYSVTGLWSAAIPIALSRYGSARNHGRYGSSRLRSTTDRLGQSVVQRYNTDMTYPDFFVAPMRAELTRLGVKELRTADAVDAAVKAPTGTLMIVVNSVCGCAAGKARPGIAMALQHHTRPERTATVFAGADIEATDRARSYFTGYAPSSPSVGLFRDGQLVFMLERRQIENQTAEQIAATLTTAFDTFCGTGQMQNTVS